MAASLKTRVFWVLHEAMIPTAAKACPACGYVQFYIETQKLKDLKASLCVKSSLMRRLLSEWPDL